MTNTSKPEPAPEQGQGDMWRLIIDDMEERRSFGLEKYGHPLQAFNGRRPLVDAYQEKLDDIVYTRQAIEELKACTSELRDLSRQAANFGEFALAERIEKVANRLWSNA